MDVSDTVTTSVLPHNLSSLSSRSRKVDVYSLSQSFRIKNFHFPCETLRFVIQESRYLCQNKVLLFFHLKVFLWVVGFSSVHGSFVYQRRRHIFFFPTQYFRVSTDNSEWLLFSPDILECVVRDLMSLLESDELWTKTEKGLYLEENIDPLELESFYELKFSLVVSYKFPYDSFFFPFLLSLFFVFTI